MNCKPGDKVTIKINGVEIETRIDDHGTQRLPCNEQLAALMSRQYNWLSQMRQMGYVSKKRVARFTRTLATQFVAILKSFRKMKSKIRCGVKNERSIPISTRVVFRAEEAALP